MRDRACAGRSEASGSRAVALTAATLLAAMAVGTLGADPERPAPEAISLLGDTLLPPALPDSVRLRYEQRLTEARSASERAPDDVDALIWLGRRTAYLGRFREAIAIYSRGLRAHPDEPRLLRHRGHRYITVRAFDLAAADLARAARLTRGRRDEIEPDGLPNARNLPTSTLQFNIRYHLGLAHYLQGDFEAARRAYRECLAVSTNADMRCATSHWLFMTLRRLGRDREARSLLEPVRRDLDVIENHSYLRLLLMYKGELPVDSLLATSTGDQGIDDATVGYGVGNWHLIHGRADEAERLLARVVAGSQWQAFGHIAAEAELARRRPAAPPRIGGAK